MADRIIKINRAPVLTLWAAVVAERLGNDHECALTLGKAVAGLNAQAKGRRLGIFQDRQEPPTERQPKAAPARKTLTIDLLGRQVPVVETSQGFRATLKDKPIEPESVQRYLEQKFGDDLEDVRTAMRTLAGTYRQDELAQGAFSLYERFRPEVPKGEMGWGAKGELDVNQIRSLGKKGG